MQSLEAIAFAVRVLCVAGVEIGAHREEEEAMYVILGSSSQRSTQPSRVIFMQ